MSLRKGDMAMVMTGKEKGKTGRIITVNREKHLVWIEKLNLVKRHQRPTQKQKLGGVIEKEAPIHISNVMYYDEKVGKPTRLGYKLIEGHKVRVSKRSGEVIEAKKP